MSRADVYAGLFTRHGRRVHLRRDGETDCSVRARIRQEGSEELVGGLDQEVRRILVLAADVTFATPLRAGDQIVLSDNSILTIERCDADTHVDGETLLAYELVATG